MGRMNYLMLPVSKIKPNNWNPNKLQDWQIEKLKDSIKKFGFIDPITVRELDDGYYEILDGEHRGEAILCILSELKNMQDTHWIDKYDSKLRALLADDPIKIPAISIGKITDEQAKQVTLALSLHGLPDTIALAELLKELDDAIGYEELEKIAPYTKDDLDALLSIENYDLEEHLRNPNIEQDEQHEYLNISFRVHTSKLPIIEHGIDRIMDLLGVRKYSSAYDGAVLEAMIMLVSHESDEEIIKAYSGRNGQV